MTWFILYLAFLFIGAALMVVSVKTNEKKHTDKELGLMVLTLFVPILNVLIAGLCLGAIIFHLMQRGEK